MRDNCPICNALLVAPAGPPQSKILIVGEFPAWNEIAKGRPFVGMAGDILKREMARAGLQYAACRVTNLWLHGKDGIGKPVKGTGNCMDWHFNECLNEMKGRRAILLMGSDCAKAFLEHNIMDVSGTKVKSPYFPKEVGLVMAAPNPAVLIHDTVGEFRLALTRFAKEVKKI